MRLPYPVVVIALAAMFVLGVLVYEGALSGTDEAAAPRPEAARACAAPQVPFTAERPISATVRATASVPVQVSVTGDGRVVAAQGESTATSSATAEGTVRATATAAIRACARGATPQAAERAATTRSRDKGRAAARRAALRLVRRKTSPALKRLRAQARSQARTDARRRAQAAVPQAEASLRRAAEQRLSGR